MGIFTYSHEEDTPAFGLVDNVPADEKQRRAEDIMAVQQEISLEKNEEKVGGVFKVIVDKKEAGRYIGRTEFDSVEVDNEVIVPDAEGLKIGEFYNVRIDSAEAFDLYGTVV